MENYAMCIPAYLSRDGKEHVYTPAVVFNDVVKAHA